MKRLSVILLFSLIVLGIISCDDDKESTNVTGVWAIESDVENSTYIQRLEYTFTANGQLEMVIFFIDKDTREILGYRSKTTGSYSRSENSLHFFDMTNYSSLDWETPYFPIEELTEVTAVQDYSVTFEVSENETKLTLDYGICDDTANCLANQTFSKSNHQ